MFEQRIGCRCTIRVGRPASANLLRACAPAQSKNSRKVAFSISGRVRVPILVRHASSARLRLNRIQRLDANRCPDKHCPANRALAGLQEDLLKAGYYTQKVMSLTGGAAITLRTERINAALKVLKGKCRFDLDPKCSDGDIWLQEDQKTGEMCGFGLTRQFLATMDLPEFVAPTQFVAASPAQASFGVADSLKSVSFDVATTKVYEILYVHKICPSSITIVCNG